MRRPDRILSADPAALAWLGGWIALVAACVWAYWPGLAGPFLFDDHKSLAELGGFGGVDDWASFKAFVFGGYAGPTGRPLAMLSFLLDANNWPADPWPFKRTNLVVHVGCGVALGLATHQVLSAVLLKAPATSRVAALVATAFWLLHPFLVSTTLYPVQRMAQLSTLFVFLGLAGYLHGRAMLAKDKRRGYAWMSIAVVVATALATLSKENGALLPLLVGIAELTIVASQRSRLGSLNRAWAATFIVLPNVLLFVYLGWRVAGTGFFVDAPGRDFSIYERLLTQFRILADYLRHWFVPDLYTSGIFQDHFIKSTGVLTPVSTLLGLLLHAMLIVAAYVTRRRYPLFAFAVLFYYGSHVIESTVLSLELYFEHRNYLAAAFLALPLIVAVQRKLPTSSFVVMSLLLCALLAGFTRYSATVWADYRTIVESAADKAPTSVRAQQQLAMLMFNDGDYDESVRVIDRALEVRPDSDTLHVTRGIILCRTGTLTDQDFAGIAEQLSTRKYDSRLFGAYTEFAATLIDEACIDDAARKASVMFENMLSFPGNRNPTSLGYSHIQLFVGYTRVRGGDVAGALQAFDRSLSARGGAGPAMTIAAILASSGQFDEALRYSEVAIQQLERGESGFGDARRVRRADILEFQANVRAELDEGATR